MPSEYSEDQLIEQATQEVLEELGWQVLTAWHNESFGPDGLLGRENKSEVVLGKYLLPALQKLNPGLPPVAYQLAVEQITQKEANKSLGRINEEKYKLLRNGIWVSYTDATGKLQKKKLSVFNFNEPEQNYFIAVRQFEVVGELYNRRPDIVGFVNGIPLVFFELKSHYNDLRNAYTDNLTDYKQKESIQHLFYCNAFIILSNGTDSRVGTVTSPYKYFLEWKRIEEDQEGVVSLDTMLRGTCAPHRLLDIFESFLLFDDSGGELKKLMAKNHQYIGVNKVLENVHHIEDLEGKLGVFWHTQGSGKSYSMVFLCEKIQRKLGGSYTFLLVTDRSELEKQLYDTFSGVGAVKNKNLIAGQKKGTTGREHLRQLLSDNHKYVFTLIHKFSIDPKKESEYPLITDRKNIIVISDEAHRTQAGTYAQNMRFRALPNASFLGFTGTPIIKEEQELTKNIFGEYVSVYDFKRAIDDEATLPLRYLNRGELLDIENPNLDEQMADVFENEDLDNDQKKKLEYIFKKDYVVLTAEPRLDAIAKDLVWHFNDRGYQGKAMLVTLDKPTAVRMHQLIMHYWPQYLAELKERMKSCQDEQEEQELQRKYQRVKETEVCVVVSPEQNEIDKFDKRGLDIRPHRQKLADRELEKEFKDPDNPFRLAIVCAMWITGFDAQCVSTVYLDKPIKSHTLMQTIARANRVYDDEKENGLIVDYGNVYRQLEKAYAVYGEGKKSSPVDNGMKANPRDAKPWDKLENDEKQLAQAIQEVIDHLNELQFDLSTLVAASAMGKIGKLKDAADRVSLNDTTRAQFEILARNVFKKYKALYPHKSLTPHLGNYNAIHAIYGQLNQSVKAADITQVMQKLQELVSESITVKNNQVAEDEPDYIDLSKLDFDKLKTAFQKAKRKNTLLHDLKKAVEQKLERMMQQNPLRLEFYERYKEIIREYNAGKDLENTVKVFGELTEFIKHLSEEDIRAIREKVSPEVLAVFDLLVKGKELSTKERNEVKKVAKKTLTDLEKTKLNIELWRESQQITAQIKASIYNHLLYLPQEQYSDEEVGLKTAAVYQHLYANYRPAAPPPS